MKWLSALKASATGLLLAGLLLLGPSAAADDVGGSPDANGGPQAAGTASVTSGAASAGTMAPARLSGCSARVIFRTSGTSICTSGGSNGIQRLKLTCYGTHGFYYIYGLWNIAGQTSSATCPNGDEAVAAQTELSG